MTPVDPHPWTIWQLRGSGLVARCEVRFAAIGVEARLLRNERFFQSCIFATGEDALAWAEEHRRRTAAETSPAGRRVH
ncbi:MAG: hypothetical protein HOP14_00315 [Acidobacteria bacterium]|nr:hypothetical protein [Acidobacteriota bacterium]